MRNYLRTYRVPFSLIALSLAIIVANFLWAIVDPIPTPTEAASAPTIAPHVGYVFCMGGYQDQGRPSSVMGVVGYRVTETPHPAFASTDYLETKSTFGKLLVFAAPCWYTEDEPNFGHIDWQSS